MIGELEIIYLCRQRFPAAAPQAVQILASAHAMAATGSDVHIFADPPGPLYEAQRPVGAGKGGGQPGRVLAGWAIEAFRHRLLADHGLSDTRNLHLHRLRQVHPTLAGLEFRGRVLQVARAASRRGRQVLLLSRRTDYAASVLRWRHLFSHPPLVVHEWHYVGSANCLERGRRAEAKREAIAENFVLQHADGHILISERLRGYLENRRPPQGLVEVVPNGGPEPVRHPADRLPCPGPIRVVYAGLFRRPADLEPLVRAVAHLRRGMGALEAIDVQVVGVDDEEHRWRAARSLAVAVESRDQRLGTAVGRRVIDMTAGSRQADICRLEFVGLRTPAETRRLLQASDIGVATFADSINMRNFASPLKIFEYHAAGIPLISTDHPTVREQVTNNVDGILVPWDQPGLLARAIIRLACEPGLARGLARSGLEAARRNTWLRRGQALRAFVERAAEERSSSGRNVTLRRRQRAASEQVPRNKPGKETGPGPGPALEHDLVHGARVGTVLRYFPTYSETFVYREIRELRRQGRPVHVVTVRRRWLRSLEAQSSLGGPLDDMPRFPLYLPIIFGAMRQVGRAPCRAICAVRWGLAHLRFKDCLKALWMADRFQRLGVSLLHVHFAGEGAEIAEIICRCTGLAYGVTLHARDIFVPRPSVPDVLGGARYLVCISEYNRQYVRDHFGEEAWAKSHVVHLGVPCRDLEGVKWPGGRQEGSFPLLAISRMVEKKGLSYLIDAVSLLRARGRSVVLTVAGEGPLRPRLEALIRRLRLESVVSLPGALTQAELSAVFASGVGAFVQPAVVAADGDRDGIPVALMEAMARAVSVVTTPVSGIPELVTDGESGLLVEPGDPVALAEAIERLMDDAGLRSALGEQGRARVLGRFRLSESVRRLQEVLEMNLST